jgi:hypothetical protein
MRRPHLYLILLAALAGILGASCASPESAIPELIQSLEAMVNATDLDGMMALFANDAIVEESFRDMIFEGAEEIELLWQAYFKAPHPSEFREISIDGDTATFIWAEIGVMNNVLWPVVIEARDGKITYMDFYENSSLEFTGDS